MKKYVLNLFFISGMILLTPAAYSDNKPFFTTSGNYQNVTVQKVVATDTIIIENHLKRGETIKLIGLRAEKHIDRSKKLDRDKYGFIQEEPVSATTPIEQEAFERVKEMLTGKKVRVEFDQSKKDNNHYTVGYVYLMDDGIFVNEEILKNGFAHLRITPPNNKHAEVLRAAYQEARREKRGLQGQ